MAIFQHLLSESLAVEIINCSHIVVLLLEYVHVVLNSSHHLWNWPGHDEDVTTYMWSAGGEFILTNSAHKKCIVVFIVFVLCLLDEIRPSSPKTREYRLFQQAAYDPYLHLLIIGDDLKRLYSFWLKQRWMWMGGWMAQTQAFHPGDCCSCLTSNQRSIPT